MTNNLPTVPAPVAISFVPVKADTAKAIRKLAEDKARQDVRRAVNAWLYAQG